MSERCLSPKEIAEQVVEASKAKANLPALPMILLGLPAGVYIGFGKEKL